MSTDGLLRRWVIASALGWLLGFVLILVIALTWESTGLPVVQFMVGLGMGCGVGIVQGRVAREWLGRPWPWIWSTTLGLGTPFLVSDLIASLVPFSQIGSVICGGLLTGILQWRLLSPHSRRTWMWIPVCTIGWTAAAAPTSMNIAGWGVLAALAIGGVILGAITGPALVRILAD